MPLHRAFPSLFLPAVLALALPAAGQATPSGQGQPCADPRWQLVEPAAARLGPGREQAGHLRIEPAEAAVQIAYRGLVIGRNKDLLLALRLRADTPRTVEIALVEDAPSGRNLGLRETLSLGPAWRDVVRILVPHTSARPARLLLNLGGSTAAIEIDTLLVRRRASSRVEPVLPPFTGPAAPCAAPVAAPAAAPKAS